MGSYGWVACFRYLRSLFPSCKACFGVNGARSDQRASCRAKEPGRTCVSSISVLSVASPQPHRWFLRGASLAPLCPCFPHRSPCCWALWRVTSLLAAWPVRMKQKWEQTSHLCSPSSAHVRDCSWQAEDHSQQSSNWTHGGLKVFRSLFPATSSPGGLCSYLFSKVKQLPMKQACPLPSSPEKPGFHSGGVFSWGESPWVPSLLDSPKCVNGCRAWPKEMQWMVTFKHIDLKNSISKTYF